LRVAATYDDLFSATATREARAEVDSLKKTVEALQDKMNNVPGTCGAR
jgi:polyhydroxyalkanoate synthesis regulator phasin